MKKLRLGRRGSAGPQQEQPPELPPAPTNENHPKVFRDGRAGILASGGNCLPGQARLDAAVTERGLVYATAHHFYRGGKVVVSVVVGKLYEAEVDSAYIPDSHTHNLTALNLGLGCIADQLEEEGQ